MKLTDQLIARLRKAPMRDDDELRDSLKNWGWLPQLPAIMDERGQVLVGNRRLRLASELGIKSLIQRVTFGAGDEADAGRVALAIASNLGGKAMTPADRRQLSQYLYGERDWSLERIAKALHTGLSKIRDDLKVPGEPKAPGSKRKREAKPMPAHDLAREIVRPYVERGETISRDELAAKHGLTPGTIQRAEIAERAVKQALADPSIKPETLSSSAKEKLDAAIRQHKKRLDQEFNQRVAEGIQKMLEKVLPELKVREAAANRTLKAYKGLMQRDGYRLILSCLHPDSRASVSAAKLEEAFRLFKGLEDVMVATALNGSVIPSSASDLRKSHGH